MFTTSNATLKSWIMLFIALAITVLFMAFAEPVITTLYLGTDSFADAMYDFNMYFSLATYISIVVWVIAILYYGIIDNVRLSSFWAWSVFCIIAVAISTATAYFYPLGVFDAENLDFIADMPGLAVVSVPLALVEYIIVSLGIKDFSINCSTRPF